MQTRQLGELAVSAIGLGCMSMSKAYGTPDYVESERTLHLALDIGYTFLDTACIYQDSQYIEHYSGLTDPVTGNPAPSAKADALGNEDISDVAKRPNSPKNTGSLIVAYDFEPTDWGQWRLQVDGTYVGDATFHPQLNKYDHTDDKTRINARPTLSDIPVSKGNLSVAAWVKNLNNEAHREWGIDFNTLGLIISSYSELSSYGIDVVYEM